MLLSALALLACGSPPGPGGGPGEDTGTGSRGDSGLADSGEGPDEVGDSAADTGRPPPSLALSVQPIWDPVAGGPLEVELLADIGGELALTLSDGDGGTLWTEALDLRAGEPMELALDGGWVERSGPLYLSAALSPGEGEPLRAEGEVLALRAAVDAAWAEDDGGETALRIPLFWHLSRTLQDFSYPFSALESLEGEDGAAADLPAASDSLDIHLGEGMIEPTAWRWDSRPILSLRIGGETRLGDAGVEGAGLWLEAEGWTVLSEGTLRPGELVLIQRDEPLADFLGVIEDSVALRFMAEDPRTGEPFPVAEQALPLRMYALYGGPSFADEGDLYHPWVAAIDAALRAIDGVEPEVEPVLDALVSWVFNDLGLVYDTRRGASAYTTYRGDWSEGHFYMSDFLGRRFGSVINCSDCAGILTSYANMLGTRLAYLIILENFDLNEILAIGQDRYTSCPFGPGGCGFSYHAVTTPDGGAHIWDSTLALDGDEDPGAAPWELLPVQGIGGGEYLERLVREGEAGYYYETIGSIQ